MFVSLSLHRSALSTWAVGHLLVLAVFLVSASPVWAGAVTYNIVNYPNSQSDNPNGGIVILDGTITTDGTFGDYTDSRHILGASLSFTTGIGSKFDFSEAHAYSVEGYNTLRATPDALLIPEGYSLVLQGTLNNEYFMNIQWHRLADPTGDYLGIVFHPLENPVTTDCEFYNVGPFSTAPGYIGNHEPWVIATPTPEPSTLAMLGIGAVGLLACGWRRRKAKAT